MWDLPGYRDFTYDVNFTTVTEEGRKLGFIPTFFSKQEALLPSDKSLLNQAVPPEIMANFLERSTREPFYVLVQKKEIKDKKSVTPQDEVKDTGRYSAETRPVTAFDLFKARVNFFKKFDEASKHTTLNIKDESKDEPGEKKRRN